MNESLRRVAVALDTSDWTTYERWCDFFGPRVGVLKVGLEAFVRWGPVAMERATKTPAAIFLDLKLHDIPQTVAGAIASARSLGARYLTVHAGGSDAMLKAAVEAAGGEIKILAVTLLTHLGGRDLERLGLPGSALERVVRWGQVAQEAGAAGVVCSPREAGHLRALLPPPFELVTPGIRPRGAASDDQTRIASPREAIEAGADLLVIGRPLTQASDPELALEALATELSEASWGSC